jgi:hypothetical protein
MTPDLKAGEDTYSTEPQIIIDRLDVTIDEDESMALDTLVASVDAEMNGKPRYQRASVAIRPIGEFARVIITYERKETTTEVERRLKAHREYAEYAEKRDRDLLKRLQKKFGTVKS